MQSDEKPTENPKETKKESVFLPLVLWVAIGVVLGLGLYLVFFQPVAPVPPTPTPNITPNVTPPTTIPNVEITLINYSACNNCNSSEFLLDQIKSLSSTFNLNISKVTYLEHDSDAAKSLISKYSINLIPTMIVSSEAGSSSDFVTGWANIGSQESDGTFVYREVYPPYYDLGDKTLKGLVEVTEIEANCSQCHDSSMLVDFLASQNVAMVFSKRTKLPQNSSEAQALISKYNITKLPAFVLSSEASVYPFTEQVWDVYGSEESDGSLVYRGVFPPYVDLTKNESVVGLVTLIELVPPNCTDCYNVSIHEDGLNQSFGLVFGNKTRILTNSTLGENLTSKYNISKVPTVILSNDATLYPDFNVSWAQMGSVESDGWLVFRALDALQVNYMNLTIPSANVSANTTSNMTNSSS
jgi:hypothetical protein